MPDPEPPIIIKKISDVHEEIGNSRTARYLLKYLIDLKAESSIIETKYIDKDYLIDFSKFYSRSIDINEKFTRRLHFFKEDIGLEAFNSILLDPTTEKQQYLQDKYLGFIVIKPLKDHENNPRENNPLIGRTALSTYDEKPVESPDEKRRYLKERQDVSLFGIPLYIDSIPFQRKDSAVSACATIACWVTLFSLSKLFEVQKLSPYEITEKSVEYPEPERNFPSSGLNIYQLKHYYNSIGLDTEYIKPEIIENIEFYSKNDDIICDVVKAYHEIGIPVIATIAIRRRNNHKSILKRFRYALRNTNLDYHAVVITGYRHKFGKIKELYVHDDNFGPFMKTLPLGNFSKWDNETTQGKYNQISVKGLLIPLYPKIRTPFKDVYTSFLAFKRILAEDNEKYGLKQDLLLTDVKKYKNELLPEKIIGIDVKNENKLTKIDILQKHLPRYLWIFRSQYQNKPKIDLIYDATSVQAKKALLLISYREKDNIKNP